MKKLTIDEFIKKSKKKHGDKYNYSMVKYKNVRTKVKIICPNHGVFEQLPWVHFKCGCTKCQNSTQEIFTEKSNEIHNNYYDYSFVEYKNRKTKIKIMCPFHGVFEQTPNGHLQGQGCPICKISKGERKIKNLLDENNVNYLRQKTFDGCVNQSNLFFDFYLVDYNVCIEYDGKLHFMSIEYFGGEEKFKYIQQNDKIKNEYCVQNNIRLERISYKDDIQTLLINIINDYIKEPISQLKV